MRRVPLLVILLIAACSPALDWREVRPEGTGLALLLPCRPQRQVREVELGAQRVRLALQSCSAGEQTWALGAADVEDPARVGPALRALHGAALVNVGASADTSLAFDVPGATPNDASRRVAFEGHLPDGRPVREQVAVFTRGTQVFQATVVGTRLSDEGVETFFGSLRFGS